MQYDKPLSFEETRGTKTYYLPFNPPFGDESGNFREATLMVRRLPDGAYHAGLAIRSAKDPFVRREGRSRAFERLQHAPYRGIVAADADALWEELEKALDQVNEHHAFTVGCGTFVDAEDVCAKLDETFDTLEKKGN